MFYSRRKELCNIFQKDFYTKWLFEVNFYLFIYWCSSWFYFYLFIWIFKNFYFYFILLYNTVLVSFPESSAFSLDEPPKLMIHWVDTHPNSSSPNPSYQVSSHWVVPWVTWDWDQLELSNTKEYFGWGEVLKEEVLIGWKWEQAFWLGQMAPLTIYRPFQRQVHSVSLLVPSRRQCQRRTSWYSYHWVP